MKLALIDSVPLSFNGGYETFLLGLAASANARGVDVRIVVPSPLAASIYFSLLSVSLRRFERDAPSPLVTVTTPWGLRSCLDWADVAYVKNEPHELLAASVAAPRSTPLVVGFHSAIDETPLGARQRFYWSKPYGRILRRASAFHVLQQTRTEWLTDVHGFNQDSIHYSPSAVDIATFSPTSSTSHTSTRVVFVGRLEHYKGLATLITAMRRLAVDEPGQFQLTIAGDGPMRNEVQGAAAECDAITYLGHRSDVAAVLGDNDVLCMPYSKDTAALAPLEALACGLPAILGDITSGRDLASEAVVLVKPGDADGLVGALTDLHQERTAKPQQWEQRRASARRQVLAGHSQEMVHERLLTMLENVAGIDSNRKVMR